MALLETLTDDFNGTTLDTGKWTDVSAGGGSLAVGSGVLNCTTSGTSGDAGVQSKDVFTIATGSALSLKVDRQNVYTHFYVDVLNSGGSAHSRFFLDGSQTQLTGQAWNSSGVRVTSTGFAYDTTTHAWVRLRFAVSGLNVTTYFETSPDGITWTIRVTSSNTAWTSLDCRVKIYANSAGATASFNTTFDRVNLGPVTTASIQDEFLGPTLDTTVWQTTTSSGNAFASIAGGFLDLNVITAGATEYVQVATVKTDYALTNSTIYIKPLANRKANTTTEFTVQNPTTGRYARFTLVGNSASITLFAQNDSGLNAVNANQAWDAVNWAYWRFRMGGTSIYFDRSVDGTTWVQANIGASCTWGNTIRVYLKLSTTSTTNTPPHLTRIDSVNMLGGAQLATPNSLTDTETLGPPALAAVQPPPQPSGIVDAETLGEPDVEFLQPSPEPAGIVDPDTLGDPGLVASAHVDPDTLVDPETLGAPEIEFALSNLEPDGVQDPETLGDPGAAFVAPDPTPDTVADPETVGAPDLVFFPSIVNPVGIVDPQTLATGTGFTFVSVYNGAYSTGDYGVGPYQGLYFSPDSIVDPAVLGEPDVFVVPPFDPDQLLPLGIEDPETLDGPELPRTDASNYDYGAGIYDEGPYYGAPGTPTDDNPVENLIYGYGTYGYGPYYGVAVSDPPQDSLPLFGDVLGHTVAPMHILGIGPWSPLIPWRGAPNYGVNPGRRPARPAMALPPATGKSFTLRLGEGGEARCELLFPRGSAVIIDEMDTDLWWRRKDPRTGRLEMIGRFNTSHTTISTSDTGVGLSAQFDDYQTVLSNRMVLKYLHPEALPNPTSMWDKGTPVIEILGFALPGNTGLDLTEVTGNHPHDLGKTTQIYHLPPGTLIKDVMEDLQAISPNAWEWWIDTPLDVGQPPKLMFKVGRRGVDKDVVLFDLGKGPTPIASWTRNGAADDYGNALYYSGNGTGTGKDAVGGTVVTIPAEIELYGQRDVQDGNSSVGGDLAALRAKARQRLTRISDRRPSYTVRLRQGFWRGREHIDVGDTVTLVLRVGDDVTQDGYRVSEITVDVDENGYEDVTLNLGRPRTSTDPRSRRSPLIRIIGYFKNYSTPPGAVDIAPDD